MSCSHQSIYKQNCKKYSFSSVEKFLRNYKRDKGTPEIIRTDECTVLMGNDFREFCEEFSVRHNVCPPYDHRGSGRVERLIRTINERLRGNPEKMTDRKNKLFYEMVATLRQSQKRDGKSPFEKMTNRKPNRITIILVNLYKYLNSLDFDRSVDLEKLEQFPRDGDSTIYVRERLHKGKLAKMFKKQDAIIRSETDHTLTLEKENGKQVVLSKRDEALGKPEQQGTSKQVDAPSSSRHNRKQVKPRRATYYQKEVPRKPTDPKILKISVDLDIDSPQAPQEKEEEARSMETTTVRERRNRKPPNWFGNPIPICELKKA